MLYFHGDVHGEIFDHFSFHNSSKTPLMTEDDILIILGDFGIPFGYYAPHYNENFLKTDQYVLNWLNSQRYKTVIVCGNHDDRDAIFRMPYCSAFGGMVRQMKLKDTLYENIYIVDTPQILTMCGKRCLVIPGAESHDICDGILDPYDPNFEKKLTKLYHDRTKLFRIKHWSWWVDEAINIPIATKLIENHSDEHFDYVLTHDCPADFILGSAERAWMKITDGENFLNSVAYALDYDFFLHGHMHVDFHYQTLNNKHIFCLYKIFMNEEDLWNTL